MNTNTSTQAEAPAPSTAFGASDKTTYIPDSASISQQSTSQPIPDKSAILAALPMLFDTDDVVELRAFTKGGKKRTDAGYFDSAHWTDLADHACRLSAAGAAVYITLNPVDPQLLGRYNNRVEAYASATTTDKQVTRRRWLLIDLDPVRPSNTSATDVQLAAARAKATAIYKHLKAQGWAEPVVAKSGNGYHLLYAITLPNDDASTALLKAVLQGLGERFDDADTKVDRSVFNAARICKLYGTVANKGDHTDVSPWRLSALVKTPARVEVTPAQLALVQPLPTPQAMPAPRQSSFPLSIAPRNAVPSSFNLEDFLSRHGLDYTPDQHDGRERFKLAACPFNLEHVDGEAAVFRDATGKLGFHCMHDSCSGKNWKALRELLDGPRVNPAPWQAWDETIKSVAACASNTGATGQNDEVFIDTHRNAPKPDPACLYGLIGDIARAGSADTEANPFAVAAAAIAYLGAAVGRGPYMAVGDDWHHANLFMQHVGRSARGRKGTAKKLVLRLAKAVKALNEHLAPQIHRGGLSSREGLALLIHDGFMEGKNEVPAIADKRLLVVESEFANILHQSGRNGNTLSPALRDTWDGVSIKPATKTSRVWASNPHVAMIADVTPSELLDLMHSRELSNGFANRFIFIWAEGDKVNPFPKPTPQPVVDALAQRIAEVLRFARADRHVDRDVLRIELSHEAATLYAQLYRGELRDRSAGERIAGLLDRRAPAFLRLAMLFALTDQSKMVEAAHVHAAMAWVRYWVDSVKFIFQSAMDEAGAAEVTSTAQKIVVFLTDRGQTTRTELSKDCLGGHVSKDKLDRALDELITASPPVIEVAMLARPKGQPGSPTKVYKLCAAASIKILANSANTAQCEPPYGFVADVAPVRSVRTLRSVGNAAEIALPGFAQFADFAEAPNPVPTRMGIDTSQVSLTSQGVQVAAAESVVLDDDVEVF